MMAHEMEYRRRTLLLAAVAGLTTLWLRTATGCLGGMLILAARGTVATATRARRGLAPAGLGLRTSARGGAVGRKRKRAVVGRRREGAVVRRRRERAVVGRRRREGAVVRAVAACGGRRRQNDRRVVAVTVEGPEELGAGRQHTLGARRGRASALGEVHAHLEH